MKIFLLMFFVFIQSMMSSYATESRIKINDSQYLSAVIAGLEGAKKLKFFQNDEYNSSIEVVASFANHRCHFSAVVTPSIGSETSFSLDQTSRSIDRCKLRITGFVRRNIRRTEF